MLASRLSRHWRCYQKVCWRHLARVRQGQLRLPRQGGDQEVRPEHPLRDERLRRVLRGRLRGLLQGVRQGRLRHHREGRDGHLHQEGRWSLNTWVRDNKKIDHPEKIEPSGEPLVVQLIGDDGTTKENVYEKLGAAVSEVTSAKDIDLSFTLFNKTINSKLCLNVGKENE